jgi:hypothetical protein
MRKKSYSTSSPLIHLESKSSRQLQEKTIKNLTTQTTPPPKKRLIMVVNSGKKNLTKNIIYHILKKPYKRPEIINGSEESLMINMGSDRERDNPVRPRLVSEERLWWKNFEARVWNVMNEMRHQIENNRREVSEQWKVMQDIKTQHNEIIIMIESLQTTIYNSGLLKEATSEPRSGTPERQTPGSNKQVIVIIDESEKEEATFKQSATVSTLKARKNKSYSFLKNKTVRIFEQAVKSELTLPTYKRPTDISRANKGELCLYHRVLGHTIKEC